MAIESVDWILLESIFSLDPSNVAPAGRGALRWRWVGPLAHGWDGRSRYPAIDGGRGCRFFEQSVAGGYQIVASSGFGGGDMKGAEAGNAQGFDLLRPPPKRPNSGSRIILE